MTDQQVRDICDRLDELIDQTRRNHFRVERCLEELSDLTCDMRHCLAHLAVTAGMDPTLVSSAPPITPDERAVAEAQEREAEAEVERKRGL